MESSNPTVRDKFREGIILIFKKWSGFRIALDDNPRVLTYFTDENDKQTLEINEMWEWWYSDIINQIEKDKIGGRVVIEKVADSLWLFIADYFGIELVDESDTEIAEILVRFYNELKEGKDDYLNKWREDDKKKTPQMKSYSIDFPILGEQTAIFEKAESGESEEEEDEDNDKIMEIDDDDEDDEEDKDKKHKKRNNKKPEKDEPDEDGFVVARKGKGF